MHKETPPATAASAGRRRNKFSSIKATLDADPGEWYNITDDIKAAGAGDKPDTYFTELARSITAGNRAGFRPRGAYEGRAEGTNIWAQAVPADRRREVPAAVDHSADDTTDVPDGDATDADIVAANARDLEPAI